MPIYTYRCENCGVQLERRQSFTDEPLTVCPECNKSQLRKVITPAGIVFKGSGWYVTDHKSKSSAVQPASAKPAADSKSESKDAAPVAPTAPAADSGSGSSASSSGDSSASKSDSSTAKSSTSE